MSESISERYRNLRASHKRWEEDVAVFEGQIANLEKIIDKPISLETLMNLLELLETREESRKLIKLEATTYPSEINSRLLRQHHNFNSSTEVVNLTAVRRGKSLVDSYINLVVDMLETTVTELNKDRTQKSEHAALCLARDIARFKIVLDGYGRYDRIHWKEIDASELNYMDYDLFNMADLMKKATEYVMDVKEDSRSGNRLWWIKEVCRTNKSQLDLFVQFIERITIYGKCPIL